MENDDYTFILGPQDTVQLTWVLEDTMNAVNPMARNLLAIVKRQIAEQDIKRYASIQMNTNEFEPQGKLPPMGDVP